MCQGENRSMEKNGLDSISYASCIKELVTKRNLNTKRSELVKRGGKEEPKRQGKVAKAVYQSVSISGLPSDFLLGFINATLE